MLGYSLEELDKLHEQFMTEFIDPLILPKALALIERHKADGDHCLIMSATNSFITGPIANRLGVHDLLATDLVIQGRHYTGDIAGTPCFQEGKVIRLRQWLKLQTDQFTIEESTFYSDSFNDPPLLVAVGRPVAVDPDDRLATIAREQGWEIISLR